MEKKQIEKLLLIASLLLLIAGIVFLCISIFGESENTTPLACALGCILLANLFNVIRSFSTLKNKDE